MSVVDIESINKVRKDIKVNLLLELSESVDSCADVNWSANIGPLVDLCAASTKFNESRNLSECERHRFIRVLSKSLQLLNLAANKTSEDILLEAIEELIKESAELYADVEVNKGEK